MVTLHWRIFLYKKYYLKDVIEASKQEKFTVISTFAGGGGSSTGYKLAGGKVLLVNEFVEAARQTYSDNYSDTQILPQDIKSLTGFDFLDAAGIIPTELDILDGSPPCSAFSISGKRDKGWDQEKVYSDGKKVENIEDLFLEYVRIAKEIQPKIIVAENVKGITAGEAKKKLNEFINAFQNIGYDVTYKVMNAAHYGVPQARERTMFVCVREDVCEAVGLNFMTLNNVFPEENKEMVTLRHALEGIENDKEEEQMLLDYVQGGFQKKWIELLEFDPPKHLKPSDERFIDINPKRSMFNMIRPCQDLPCPTLTQRGQQTVVSGVFHPMKNRKFTVPELKRIMSLPEDFVMKSDRETVAKRFDQSAERIGRMVAPKMMAALANSLYEKVLRPFNEL
tara:strand:- start:2246 stop:3427 length:1182 start_codon:yes stop_codon:yes gene_type:complete